VTRARYEEREARWPEAVASYEKALDRRPTIPRSANDSRTRCARRGRICFGATRLAELASSRSPRNAGYRKTLGLVYADGGLREKAIEQFEKVLEIEPSDEVRGARLRRSGSRVARPRRSSSCTNRGRGPGRVDHVGLRAEELDGHLVQPTKTAPEVPDTGEDVLRDLDAASLARPS